MFSIIVCSVNTSRSEILKKNIEATIGLPVEFIIYNNNNTGKGICQVYNECAEKAKYENLCFVHEDVEFVTEGWGELIARKLQEKDCGVIGFAGATAKTKSKGSWAPYLKRSHRTNYISYYKGKEFYVERNPNSQDFSEVVALDGLCLFCTKERWLSIKFDDETLKGFHCYDLDFSISANVAGYKNYVCHVVLVKHFSNGNYDSIWWKESQKMHKKWEDKLPIYVDKNVSNLSKIYNEYWSDVDLTNKLSKSGIFLKNPKRYISGYILTHPLNLRSYKLIGRYIKYLRTGHK